MIGFCLKFVLLKNLYNKGCKSFARQMLCLLINFILLNSKNNTQIVKFLKSPILLG